MQCNWVNSVHFPAHACMHALARVRSLGYVCVHFYRSVLDKNVMSSEINKYVVFDHLISGL